MDIGCIGRPLSNWKTICIKAERRNAMNARKMFARAVAGRFLDRINRINRILGNGSNILNLVNPVNPV